MPGEVRSSCTYDEGCGMWDVGRDVERRTSSCCVRLPGLGNVLASLLLEVPELASLLSLEVAHFHGDFDESLLHALAHAPGTTADEDSTIDRVDHLPDELGLVAHLLLDVAALAAAALDNLLDLVLVDAPLAAVDLVDERVPDALDDPDLVGAVGRLEAALDEAAERRDSDAGTDEDHGSVGDELGREGVGHEALEHGHVDLGRQAGSLGLEELARLALEEAGTNTRPAAKLPVIGLVDGHGNLDEAARLALAALANLGLVRVVGEGVEAGHELLEHGKEDVKGRVGAGESVKKLGDRHVRPGSEVAENRLALGRAEEEEKLALVLVIGMLGENA